MKKRRWLSILLVVCMVLSTIWQGNGVWRVQASDDQEAYDQLKENIIGFLDTVQQIAPKNEQADEYGFWGGDYNREFDSNLYNILEQEFENILAGVNQFDSTWTTNWASREENAEYNLVYPSAIYTNSANYKDTLLHISCVLERLYNEDNPWTPEDEGWISDHQKITNLTMTSNEEILDLACMILDMIGWKEKEITYPYELCEMVKEEDYLRDTEPYTYYKTLEEALSQVNNAEKMYRVYYRLYEPITLTQSLLDQCVCSGLKIGSNAMISGLDMQYTEEELNLNYDLYIENCSFTFASPCTVNSTDDTRHLLAFWGVTGGGDFAYSCNHVQLDCDVNNWQGTVSNDFDAIMGASIETFFKDCTVEMKNYTAEQVTTNYYNVLKTAIDSGMANGEFINNKSDENTLWSVDTNSAGETSVTLESLDTFLQYKDNIYDMYRYNFQRGVQGVTFFYDYLNNDNISDISHDLVIFANSIVAMNNSGDSIKNTLTQLFTAESEDSFKNSVLQLVELTGEDSYYFGAYDSYEEEVAAANTIWECMHEDIENPDCITSVALKDSAQVPDGLYDLFQDAKQWTLEDTSGMGEFQLYYEMENGAPANYAASDFINYIKNTMFQIKNLNDAKDGINAFTNKLKDLYPKEEWTYWNAIDVYKTISQEDLTELNQYYQAIVNLYDLNDYDDMNRREDSAYTAFTMPRSFTIDNVANYTLYLYYVLYRDPAQDEECRIMNDTVTEVKDLMVKADSILYNIALREKRRILPYRYYDMNVEQADSFYFDNWNSMIADLNSKEETASMDLGLRGDTWYTLDLSSLPDAYHSIQLFAGKVTNQLLQIPVKNEIIINDAVIDLSKGTKFVGTLNNGVKPTITFNHCKVTGYADFTNVNVVKDDATVWNVLSNPVEESQPVSGGGTTEGSENNQTVTGEQEKTVETVTNGDVTETKTTTVSVDSSTGTKAVTEETVAKNEKTGETTTQIDTVYTETNGTTVETSITKGSDGEVNQATSTVNLCAANIAYDATEKEAAVNVAVASKSILESAKQATSEVPLQVELKLPTTAILSCLVDGQKDAVVINTTIPTALYQTDHIAVSNIELDKDILLAAKKADTDVNVSISAGDSQYQWGFEAEDMKNAKSLHTLNLNLTIGNGKNAEPEVEAILKNDTKNDVNNTICVNFAHSGDLGIPATVTLSVKNIDGIMPGQNVSMYYVNEKENVLDALPNATYTADSNYMLKVGIIHCSNYVLVPNKPASKLIRSLFSQISGIPAKKTLYLSGTKAKTTTIKPVLPSTITMVKAFSDTIKSGMTEATITYTSSNKKVATVNKTTGKVKAKKAGKTTIRTTVKLADGTKKVYKTTITVKK